MIPWNYYHQEQEYRAATSTTTAIMFHMDNIPGELEYYEKGRQGQSIPLWIHKSKKDFLWKEDARNFLQFYYYHRKSLLYIFLRARSPSSFLFHFTFARLAMKNDGLLGKASGLLDFPSSSPIYLLSLVWALVYATIGRLNGNPGSFCADSRIQVKVVCTPIILIIWYLQDYGDNFMSPIFPFFCTKY